MRIIVGIGQMRVVDAPSMLVGLALGSCVGLMIYDQLNHVGGLAHIMLPSSKDGAIDSMPAKFADRAVPLMLDRIERLGGKAVGCRAKLVGGAQMFLGGQGVKTHVGVRNVEAVKTLLAEDRIPIVAEDTGGEYARTVEFNTESFDAVIKSILRGQRQI